MNKIPSFPIKKINPRVSLSLKPVSDYLLRGFPNLPRYLEISSMDIQPRDYVALGVLNALFIFSSLFASLMLLAFIQGGIMSFLRFSLIASTGMLAFSFFYWMSFPTVVARRKAELIEKDLLFALRDISVQTSGGLSFKESIDSVAEGGYGELSTEMKRISEEISFGNSIEDALENSLHRNTSAIYRSVMVRISDGLRTGTDVSSLLQIVINNLGEDLKNKVKKYGQEINMWVTLYLVVGIVLPSMGLTLMIMLSSFSGIVLTQTTFYLITVFLIFFHGSALSILKSRRPVVEI